MTYPTNSRGLDFVPIEDGGVLEIAYDGSPLDLEVRNRCGSRPQSHRLIRLKKPNVVKIVILSRNLKLYSTQRLIEAAQTAGHDVHVLDVLRCYMNITSAKPSIHYKAEELPPQSRIADFFEPRGERASIRLSGCTG
ncbi:MAG: hypothetical protein ACRER2_01955 [Methylococcales bacterium]